MEPSGADRGPMGHGRKALETGEQGPPPSLCHWSAPSQDLRQRGPMRLDRSVTHPGASPGLSHPVLCGHQGVRTSACACTCVSDGTVGPNQLAPTADNDPSPGPVLFLQGPVTPHSAVPRFS